MMTTEQFEREKGYQCTRWFTESMQKESLITEDEYRQIETILREHFRPILGLLRT